MEKSWKLNRFESSLRNLHSSPEQSSNGSKLSEHSGLLCHKLSNARLSLQRSSTCVPSSRAGSLVDQNGLSANQYFAFETRQKATERLVALQKQLPGLLVRGKLAWMKCFATHTELSSKNTIEPAWDHARQLVELGEALATNLETAFECCLPDTSSRLPVEELKDLIDTTENQFEQYEKLIASLVSAPSPTKTVPRRKERSKAVSNVSAFKHPVEFDLPSMQTYCAKVAPPYTAYTQ